MKKKVFISKLLSAHALVSLKVDAADFFMQSLVSLVEIDFEVPELHENDLILIHSVNGAEMLLNHTTFNTQLKRKKLNFWTPGASTLAYIQKNFGNQHDFVSFNPSDWELNGEQIKKDYQRIISFQSSASQRSFDKALKDHEVLEIEIYNSMSIPTLNYNIPFDFVLLTSPLNAISFLRSNCFDEHTHWICIGATTTKVLKSNLSNSTYINTIEKSDIRDMIAFVNQQIKV